MREIKSGLDVLASSLLNEADGGGEVRMTVDQRIDIFKAVAAYYLGTVRATKGKGTDDSNVVNFRDILAKIKPETTNRNPS